MANMSIRPHASSVKPQSAARPKSDSPQPPAPAKAEHRPPEEKPRQRGDNPGQSITGGVDSKTQFLATQKLQRANQPVTRKAAGGVRDDQDENGLTAQQLNTTGPAAAVSDQEIQKAAGGDPKIAGLLKKLDTDIEGHKALRLALDKGTTYKRGELDGNVVGLTQSGGGRGPVITLESMSMDTVAHETAHAAYSDMSHAEVYRFGRRVENRVNNGETRPTLGSDPATTPESPTVSRPPNKRRPAPTQSNSTPPRIGNRGGSPTPTRGNSGVPDDQDENGLTAIQLNTLGPARPVTDEEIALAAGGDPEIIALLKKMDQDPEGHKALRLALDKGTTYKRGELDGNVVGLTQSGGGRGPVITLESMSMDTVAHETAHAAYPDMSHAEVYRFGHRVEDRLDQDQAA